MHHKLILLIAESKSSSLACSKFKALHCVGQFHCSPEREINETYAGISYAALMNVSIVCPR